jgi:hypothetical protein
VSACGYASTTKTRCDEAVCEQEKGRAAMPVEMRLRFHSDVTIDPLFAITSSTVSQSRVPVLVNCKRTSSRASLATG